ncbi:MAG: FkbM family methyltransferase [Planctomycetia bacterium]|nr:FkbM family methyltransferase [Planctomycetia bacterium]
MSNPFEPFLQQKTCRHGQMLYNIHDQYIGRSLDLYGEFSEGEIDLFRQLVREGDVALDVGANIGAHTVFLAQHVGPRGSVFAFEPQRVVFQTLCANVALNQLTNVDCRQAAVGATAGEIIVPEIDYRRYANFGGLSLDGWEQGRLVPVVAIDQLQLSKCEFIKVDVEGMEVQVVRGARDTLSRLRPLLYVENDRSEKSRDLIQLLRDCDYELYWHTPRMFNANNFFGNANNEFGDIVSHNMLCVHREVPHDIQGLRSVELPI